MPAPDSTAVASPKKGFELPPDYQNQFHGPVVSRDPRRAAIHGITDTIAGLKETVASLEIHDGLKQFIQDELDKIADTGAELHLHDVEMVNDGKLMGFNLHVCVTHKTLGASRQRVFIRKS